MKKFSMMILGMATGYHQLQLPIESEDFTTLINSKPTPSSPMPSIIVSEGTLPAKASPLIPSGKRVLIVGDSLGMGFGPHLEKTLRENNYETYLHTVLGSTTKRWMSMIMHDLTKYKPSLVVVSLGTNDSVANQEWLERNKEVYSRFVELVESSGAKLVWVGPPEVKRKLLLRLSIVRQYISEASPLLYDTRTINIPLSEDGVHSTPVGYKLWADSIWDWMLASNILVAN